MSRVARLEVFADQDPSNPILLCDLIDALLAEGRVPDAIVRLRSVDDELRSLPSIRFREARCAMLQQDFATVIDLLQPLINESVADPVPVGIVHDLAYAQFALGHWDDALETLDHVPQSQGEDAIAVALLKARVLHHQGHFGLALNVLGPITTGPRWAEVAGLRAMLMLDSGDRPSAAAAAAKALDSDPTQYEAAIVAGTIALWERRLEASEALFDQVLTTDPRAGRALLGVGQIRMLHADLPAARAVLDRAVAAMPDHIGSWHALAWCQLLEGDLAGAQGSLERAFAIDRTFGETHGGFALVHALRGERHEAEEFIKRARRLDPNGPSARYAQSVLLLDEGRAQEATKIIESILEQSAGDTPAVPADFIFRLRDLVRPRS